MTTQSCAECGERPAVRFGLFCASCEAATVADLEATHGPLVGAEDQYDLLGTTLAPTPCSICHTRPGTWRTRRRAHVCAACEVGS